MRLFPLLVRLEGRRVLVVGGGPVAERKVRALLATGARIQVIAPQVTPALQTWIHEGKVLYEAREARPEDGEGAFLVLVATDDPHLGVQWATRMSTPGLLNVADAPEVSTVFLPSVIRRGDLTVAISTSGACPALARHLRTRLETLLGPEYGPFLSLLAQIRTRLQERVPDPDRRRQLLYALIRSDLLEAVAQGDRDRIRQRIQEHTGLTWEEVFLEDPP